MSVRALEDFKASYQPFKLVEVEESEDGFQISYKCEITSSESAMSSSLNTFISQKILELQPVIINVPAERLLFDIKAVCIGSAGVWSWSFNGLLSGDVVAELNMIWLKHLMDHMISSKLSVERRKILRINVTEGKVGPDDDIKSSKRHFIRVGQTTKTIATRISTPFETKGHKTTREVKLKIRELDDMLVKMGYSRMDFLQEMIERIEGHPAVDYLLRTEINRPKYLMPFELWLESPSMYTLSKKMANLVKLTVAACGEINPLEPVVHTSDVIIKPVGAMIEASSVSQILEAAELFSGYTADILALDREFMRSIPGWLTEHNRSKARGRNTNPEHEIRVQLDGVWRTDFKSQAEFMKMTRYYKTLLKIASSIGIKESDTVIYAATGHAKSLKLPGLIIRTLYTVKMKVVRHEPVALQYAAVMTDYCVNSIHTIETILGNKAETIKESLHRLFHQIASNNYLPVLAALAHDYMDALRFPVELPSSDYRTMMLQMKGVLAENFVAKAENLTYALESCKCLDEIVTELLGPHSYSDEMPLMIEHRPDITRYEYRNEKLVSVTCFEVGYLTGESVAKKAQTDRAIYSALFTACDGQLTGKLYARHVHLTGKPAEWNRVYNDTVERPVDMDQIFWYKALVHDICNLVNTNATPEDQFEESDDLVVSGLKKSMKRPRFVSQVCHSEDCVNVLNALAEQTCNLFDPGMYERLWNKEKEYAFRKDFKYSNEVIDRASQIVWDYARDHPIHTAVTPETVEDLVRIWKRELRKIKTKEPTSVDSFGQISINFNYTRTVVTYVDQMDLLISEMSNTISRLPQGRDKTVGYKCLDVVQLWLGSYIKQRLKGHLSLYNSQMSKITCLWSRTDWDKIMVQKADKAISYAREQQVQVGSSGGVIGCVEHMSTIMDRPLPARQENPTGNTKAAFQALEKIEPIWTLTGGKFAEEVKRRKDPDRYERKSQERRFNVPWDKIKYTNLETYFKYMQSDMDEPVSTTRFLNEFYLNKAKEMLKPGTSQWAAADIIEVVIQHIRTKRYTAVWELMKEIGTIWLTRCTHDKSYGRFAISRLPNFNSYVFMNIIKGSQGQASAVIVRDKVPKKAVMHSANGKLDDGLVSNVIYLNKTNGTWYEASPTIILSSVFVAIGENKLWNLLGSSDEDTLWKIFDDLCVKFTWIVMNNKKGMERVIGLYRYLCMNTTFGSAMMMKPLVEKLVTPIRHTNEAWLVHRLQKVTIYNSQFIPELSETCQKYMKGESSEMPKLALRSWVSDHLIHSSATSVIQEFYHYHLVANEIRNSTQMDMAVTAKNWKEQVKLEKLLQDEDISHEVKDVTLGVCEEGLHTADQVLKMSLSLRDRVPWSWCMEHTTHLLDNIIQTDHSDITSVDWKRGMSNTVGLSTLIKPTTVVKFCNHDIHFDKYRESKRAEQIKKTALTLRAMKGSGSITKAAAAELTTQLHGVTKGKEYDLMISVLNREFTTPTADMVNILSGSMKGTLQVPVAMSVLKKVANDSVSIANKMKKKAPIREPTRTDYYVGYKKITCKGADVLEHLDKVTSDPTFIDMQVFAEISSLSRDVKPVYRTQTTRRLLGMIDHLYKTVSGYQVVALLINDFLCCMVDEGKVKKNSRGNIHVELSQTEREDYADSYAERSGLSETSLYIMGTLMTMYFGDVNMSDVVSTYGLDLLRSRSLTEAAEQLMFLQIRHSFKELASNLPALVNDIVSMNKRAHHNTTQRELSSKSEKQVFVMGHMVTVHNRMGVDCTLGMHQKNSILDKVPDHVGQRSKKQRLGEREIGVGEVKLRIHNPRGEDLYTALNGKFTEETLSKGSANKRVPDNVFATMLTALRSRHKDGQSVAYTFWNMDHAGWSPGNFGRKFEIMPDLLSGMLGGDESRLQRMIMLRAELKYGEISTPTWRQFIDIGDKWEDGGNVTLDYLKAEFDKKPAGWKPQFMTTVQGFKHQASSTYITLVHKSMMKTAARILSKMGITLDGPIRDASDDAFVGPMTSWKGDWPEEAVEDGMDDSTEMQLRMLDYMTYFKCITGQKVGAKSAASGMIIEYNSMFNWLGRTQIATNKFVTSQMVLPSTTDFEAVQCWVKNTCLTILCEDGDFLTSTVSWMGMQTRMGCFTKPHEVEKAVDMSVMKLPPAIGGLVSPEITDLVYRNNKQTNNDRLRTLVRKKLLLGVITRCEVETQVLDYGFMVQNGDILKGIICLPLRSPRPYAMKRIEQFKDKVVDTTLSAEETSRQPYLKKKIMELLEPLNTEVELYKVAKILSSKGFKEATTRLDKTATLAALLERVNGRFVATEFTESFLKEYDIPYHKMKSEELRISILDFLNITRHLPPDQKMDGMISRLLAHTEEPPDTKYCMSSYLDRDYRGQKESVNTVSGKSELVMYNETCEIDNKIQDVLCFLIYPDVLAEVGTTRMKWYSLPADIATVKKTHDDQIKYLMSKADSHDDKLEAEDLFKIDIAWNDIQDKFDPAFRKNLNIVTGAPMYAKPGQTMDAFSRFNIVKGCEMLYEGTGVSPVGRPPHASQMRSAELIASICWHLEPDATRFAMNMRLLLDIKLSDVDTVSTMLTRSLTNSRFPDDRATAAMILHLLGRMHETMDFVNIVKSDRCGVEEIRVAGSSNSYLITTQSSSAIVSQNRDGYIEITGERISNADMHLILSAYEYGLTGHIPNIGSKLIWSKYYTSKPVSCNWYCKIMNGKWEVAFTPPGLVFHKRMVIGDVKTRFNYRADELAVYAHKRGITVSVIQPQAPPTESVIDIKRVRLNQDILNIVGELENLKERLTEHTIKMDLRTVTWRKKMGLSDWPLFKQVCKRLGKGVSLDSPEIIEVKSQWEESELDMSGEDLELDLVKVSNTLQILAMSNKGKFWELKNKAKFGFESADLPKTQMDFDSVVMQASLKRTGNLPIALACIMQILDEPSDLPNLIDSYSDLWVKQVLNRNSFFCAYLIGSMAFQETASIAEDPSSDLEGKYWKRDIVVSELDHDKSCIIINAERRPHDQAILTMYRVLTCVEFTDTLVSGSKHLWLMTDPPSRNYHLLTVSEERPHELVVELRAVTEKISDLKHESKLVTERLSHERKVKWQLGTEVQELRRTGADTEELGRRLGFHADNIDRLNLELNKLELDLSDAKDMRDSHYDNWLGMRSAVDGRDLVDISNTMKFKILDILKERSILAITSSPSGCLKTLLDVIRMDMRVHSDSDSW